MFTKRNTSVSSRLSNKNTITGMWSCLATTTLLCLIIAKFISWLINSIRRPVDFPPGPPRVPILGSLPFVAPFKSSVFGINFSFLGAKEKLAEKYGNVCGFFMGTTPVVLISDPDVMRDAFRKDETAAFALGRIQATNRTGGHKRTDGTAPGVFSSQGQEWQEQRRFTLKTLKDFGFGRQSTEDAVVEEVERLCSLLAKKTGQPLSLEFTFNLPTVNSLWKLVMGEVFEDLEDPRLLRLCQAISQMLSLSGSHRPWEQLLPHWLAVRPPFDLLTDSRIMANASKAMRDVYMPVLQRHIDTFGEDSEVKDFTDMYLANINRTNDPDSSFFQEKGMDSLRCVIGDLFFAGLDTTSRSLLWSIFYMVHHPEIQATVQEELDRFFGRKTMPTLTSTTKEDLPYTHAVVIESLRKTGLAHMAVPHRAIADFRLAGYHIPQGTILLQNIYHVHHDRRFWQDPEKFDPCRFLDADQKYFVSSERVIPFGVGKRQCLGQTLAEKELFLFFTGLLHRFKVEAAPGITLPSYGMDVGTATTGIARQCPKFYVVLTKRDC